MVVAVQILAGLAGIGIGLGLFLLIDYMSRRRTRRIRKRSPQRIDFYLVRSTSTEATDDEIARSWGER